MGGGAALLRMRHRRLAMLYAHCRNFEWDNKLKKAPFQGLFTTSIADHFVTIHLTFVSVKN
jgi:hypothetical protein